MRSLHHRRSGTVSHDEDSAACELYRFLQDESDSDVNQEEEWKARMPGLYYEQGPTAYTLNDVPLTVALRGDGSSLSHLRPVAKVADLRRTARSASIGAQTLR